MRWIFPKKGKYFDKKGNSKLHPLCHRVDIDDSIFKDKHPLSHRVNTSSTTSTKREQEINDMKIINCRYDDVMIAIKANKEAQGRLMLQWQVSNACHKETVNQLRDESARLRQQIQDLEKNRECSVCWVNPDKRDPPPRQAELQGFSILIPCGHWLCSACAHRIISGADAGNRVCPTCRDPVSSIQRVFI